MQVSQQELNDAIQRRKKLQDQKQRMRGKLESAQTRLKELQDKCRTKGVDPEGIGEVLTKIEEAYRQRVAAIVERVDLAEKQLAPYLEDSV